MNGDLMEADYSPLIPLTLNDSLDMSFRVFIYSQLSMWLSISKSAVSSLTVKVTKGKKIHETAINTEGRAQGNGGRR